MLLPVLRRCCIVNQDLRFIILTLNYFYRLQITDVLFYLDIRVMFERLMRKVELYYGVATVLLP